MISFWISVVPPNIDWTRPVKPDPADRVLAHVAVITVQMDD
jgi:hypothetical protein